MENVIDLIKAGIEKAKKENVLEFDIELHESQMSDLIKELTKQPILISYSNSPPIDNICTLSVDGYRINIKKLI